MIISHEHEFAFIHIGKTGGTSIESALSYALGFDFELTYHNPDILDGDCKHLNASRLRDIVGADTWERYRTFAFVRNPWDRLLSDWCMHKQADPRVPWRNKEWIRYERFEDFLEGLRKSEVAIGRDYQSWMMSDADGNVIVDFVGRFENLEEDFRQMCRLAKIPEVEIPHHAATEHRSYVDYYTPDTVQAVADWCRRDCGLFQYEFTGKVAARNSCEPL